MRGSAYLGLDLLHSLTTRGCATITASQKRDYEERSLPDLDFVPVLNSVTHMLIDTDMPGSHKLSKVAAE